MGSVLLLTACGTTDDRQAQVSQGDGSATTATTKPVPNTAGIEKPQSASENSVKAPVSSGRDSTSGASFSLEDKTLTVTLSKGSDVNGFAGQRVRVDCVSQRRQADGVARTLRWPARSRTLKVRFPDSAGSPPIFCSVDTASLQDRSYHVDAVLN